MRESRSPPPFNEEPQISKDFWGFFVFLPADLFLLRWGYSSPGAFTSDFFFFVFLHRISRMNRKAILLIGLLTDFRGYLAAGQWLAPEMSSYCFFVTQISQIYTDFFLFPVVYSFFCIFFISQILDLSVRDGFRRFLWTLFSIIAHSDNSFCFLLPNIFVCCLVLAS